MTQVQAEPAPASTERTSRVLLVDDTPTNLQVLFQTLDGLGLELLIAQTGEEALKIAADARPELVLLDIMMPGIDGYETCRRLKADDATSEAAVIFMSALNETEDKVKGLNLGAVDYITKPFQAEEVIARVKTHLTIHNLRRELAVQNGRLEAANARLHHDLEAAARVQQSLLPATLPAMRGSKFAWRYDPCDELAGDLLNIVAIDKCRVVLYVADVSGHGVAASLVSVAVHRSLSLRRDQSSLIVTPGTNDESLEVTAPAEVADRLNNIYPMESNGGHFLTLIYGVLDLDSRVLDYCCAGHAGPILCRAGEKARSFDAPHFPIGIAPDPDYADATLQLQPDDRVYFYSDGLIEAADASRNLFGRERLEAEVDATRGLPLKGSIDAIVDAAARWQGSGSFDDDVSILAVQIEA